MDHAIEKQSRASTYHGLDLALAFESLAWITPVKIGNTLKLATGMRMKRKPGLLVLNLRLLSHDVH